MKREQLDILHLTDSSQKPQFVFGIILVIAWLSFLTVPLSQASSYDKNSPRPDPLASAKRISALFTAALGFVWGHYFGKSSGDKLAEAATRHAR